MNVRKAISKEAISISLQASDKQGIVEEMIDLLVAAGKITDRKAAIKAVMEREKKMSTGMHHGVAIPHGKTDSVDGLVACIGLLPAGVDFNSMDGQPSRIFILTISPANRAGPHIQFLAEISRLLNRQEIRKQLVQATSADEIFELLT